MWLVLDICNWNDITVYKKGLLLLLEFFTSALADGFSLGSEWQQVSRTLLSILAFLNNVVVWMVSTCPPTSKSSSPFSNPLITVPKALITIGIIVTCMFHSLDEVLILLFTFFQFYTASSLLFVGLVFWPRLGDPCVAEYEVRSESSEPHPERRAKFENFFCGNTLTRVV